MPWSSPWPSWSGPGTRLRKARPPFPLQLPALPERRPDRDAVPEDDLEGHQVVLAGGVVERVVVVLAALVGEVGDLREVDGHLPGRAGGARERDLLAVRDHPPVVGRDAPLLKELEIRGAHRAQRRALVRDGVGHLPPVEHGVVVGEHEPAPPELLRGRLLLDPELLHARHCAGVHGPPLSRFLPRPRPGGYPSRIRHRGRRVSPVPTAVIAPAAPLRL